VLAGDGRCLLAFATSARCFRTPERLGGTRTVKQLRFHLDFTSRSPLGMRGSFSEQVGTSGTEMAAGAPGMRGGAASPPCACLGICALPAGAVVGPGTNACREQRRCRSASTATLKRRQNRQSWCFRWRNASLGRRPPRLRRLVS